jgi:hypothetical protein
MKRHGRERSLNRRHMAQSRDYAEYSPPKPPSECGTEFYCLTDTRCPQYKITSVHKSMIERTIQQKERDLTTDLAPFCVSRVRIKRLLRRFLRRSCCRCLLRCRSLRHHADLFQQLLLAAQRDFRDLQVLRDPIVHHHQRRILLLRRLLRRALVSGFSHNVIKIISTSASEARFALVLV